MADFNGSIQDPSLGGTVPQLTGPQESEGTAPVGVSVAAPVGLKQPHFNPGIDLE